MRARVVVSVAAVAALVGALAPTAQAHGLTVRADIPIPIWLFAYAAAVVLVISFVGLAVLWRTPVLEADRFRPLPEALSRALTSRAVDALCGAVGLFLLGVTIWSGYAGSAIITDNFAPTFVYITFWLGFAAVNAFFGDVFRAFNPWRAGGRLVGWLARPLMRATEPLAYPAWLGRWPAALGLVAFVWLEVVAIDGQRTDGIATATVVYSAITWLAMMVFGVETWTRKGEAFSAYFGLFARMSPFERRGRTIGLRPPLSGLARLEPETGLAAVVLVMIGTVSFDGGSGGPAFQSLVPTLQDLYAGGFGPFAQIELTFGTGLIAALVLVSGFYLLGIVGVQRVDGVRSVRELAGIFAPSLVPIAFAYAAAHYVSLLLLGGQNIAHLASDPLGRGWDLFGTATWKADYGLIGAETFWYLQVVLIVVGHAAGLAVAHDRALTLYRDARQATRSQYWMLVIMIGFTSLALWLLSQANDA